MWELEGTNTTKPSPGAKSHQPERVLDRSIGLSLWSEYWIPRGDESGREGRGREGSVVTWVSNAEGVDPGQWGRQEEKRTDMKDV